MVKMLEAAGRALGSIIRFPFTALAFLLGWTSSLIVKILLLVILLISVPTAAISTYWLLDYKQNAYRYSYSDKCELRDLLFPGINFDFTYSCIDASRFKENSFTNFVFFMSSEDNPTPGRTGHGWLALMRLSKKDANIRIHDWQVLGFWGDNTFNCSALTVSIYSIVAPWLPYRQIIEQNYKAFCMGGVSGLESPNTISSVEGVPFPQIKSLNEIHTLLARRPSHVLAVAIDAEQFNNVRWLSSESSRRSYSVLLNDCTTLLYRIAQSAGLYTPPRLLFPFPSDSVEAFRDLNTR